MSSQVPMSDHRLIAMRDCDGVMLEHAELQAGAAPGGTLWLDRIAYVIGESHDKLDQYFYLAHTTAYGYSTHARRHHRHDSHRPYLRPVGFELNVNAAIGPIGKD